MLVPARDYEQGRKSAEPKTKKCNEKASVSLYPPPAPARLSPPSLPQATQNSAPRLFMMSCSRLATSVNQCVPPRHIFVSFLPQPRGAARSRRLLRRYFARNGSRVPHSCSACHAPNEANNQQNVFNPGFCISLNRKQFNLIHSGFM